MAYHILWIDDDTAFLETVRTSLDGLCELHVATSLSQGLQLLSARPIDLVLLDIALGSENGLEGLQLIKKDSNSVDVVMVSGERDPRQIVQSIRAGAADYLSKPFDIDELIALIEKLRAVKGIRDRHDALVADLNPASAAHQFIGVSTAFRTMLSQTDRLKGHKANVLIEGESGTGKELLARYIHSLEHDNKRPFIAVNCAAIPEGLIESELFGHERGAFTGATQRKLGKFELANGGDIFLDEISSLRLDLQAKILRVLQEKEVVRVGGGHPLRVDFRVISATNENLERLVAKGQFRMDLFHRLRVIQLHAPALRQRREDIPLLVAHFLDKYGKTTGPKRITADALRRLQEYDWPGNVRELENVIHSLIILSPDEIIDQACLPQSTSLQVHDQQRLQRDFPETTWQDGDQLPCLREYVRTAERTYVEHVMQMHGGDKTAVATALHVGRTTLYSKLKELGIAH
ncbi:MAG: sigma-54-dependent Fis family transcriptional regulator [Deltaproteobacteria bacterium]|nr:sigma-54-dependent Fis family transcriptional regulator [Deltaproteobacteria bacterium]